MSESPVTAVFSESFAWILLALIHDFRSKFVYMIYYANHVYEFLAIASIQSWISK